VEDKRIGPAGYIRWIAQLGLGALLIILLGVHLVVNHLVAPQGLLTYADIVDYYDIPGIVFMEALFLVVVTSHSLLGLHSILLDLNLRPSLTRTLTWLLIILGAAAIIYGTRLLLAIAAR
jgi:succinate dehydrogenase hydrophobic anchor subunit